jgi:hypothetical protein
MASCLRWSGNVIAISGRAQPGPLQRVVSHRLATLVPVQRNAERSKCPQQWGQVAEPVAARDENDHSKRQFSNRLLVCKIAVNGHERVDISGRGPEQFAVFHTGPSGLGHSPHVMFVKVFLQAAG